MIRTALNGISHYRRISLVMAIAVAIATTVVGGALVVGDSIRYSLRQMTEERLGQVTTFSRLPCSYVKNWSLTSLTHLRMPASHRHC